MWTWSDVATCEVPFCEHSVEAAPGELMTNSRGFHFRYRRWIFLLPDKMRDVNLQLRTGYREGGGWGEGRGVGVPPYTPVCLPSVR